MIEQVKERSGKSRAGSVFLITLLAVFLIAPWSLKNKLDAVCFGI